MAVVSGLLVQEAGYSIGDVDFRRLMGQLRRGESLDSTPDVGMTELNQFDENGWSPLHLASFMGNATAARHLLDAGACPCLLDEHSQRPVDLTSDVETKRVLLLRSPCPSSIHRHAATLTSPSSPYARSPARRSYSMLTPETPELRLASPHGGKQDAGLDSNLPPRRRRLEYDVPAATTTTSTASSSSSTIMAPYGSPRVATAASHSPVASLRRDTPNVAPPPPVVKVTADAGTQTDLTGPVASAVAVTEMATILTECLAVMTTTQSADVALLNELSKEAQDACLQLQEPDLADRPWSAAARLAVSVESLLYPVERAVHVRAIRFQKLSQRVRDAFGDQLEPPTNDHSIDSKVDLSMAREMLAKLGASLGEREVQAADSSSKRTDAEAQSLLLEKELVAVKAEMQRLEEDNSALYARLAQARLALRKAIEFHQRNA